MTHAHLRKRDKQGSRKQAELGSAWKGWDLKSPFGLITPDEQAADFRAQCLTCKTLSLDFNYWDCEEAPTLEAGRVAPET